ncbi:hypothetical protein RB195_008743 [Necator americanus]
MEEKTETVEKKETVEKTESVEKITRLYPFEALEADYYMGDEATGGVGRDSEEELSSDDELQQELRKLAGIKRDCVQKRRKEKPVPSEFEMDMEYELDQLITDYANEHLSGNRKREEDVKKVSAKEFVEQCQEDEMPELIGSDDDEEEEEKQNDQPDSTESVPSKKQRLDEVTTVIDTPKSENMDIEEGMTEAGPSSSTVRTEPMPAPVVTNEEQPMEKEREKKHVTFDESAKKDEEEEKNPIKKAAMETMKDVEKELVEFYDPEEDDNNEKWMQQQRKRTTGMSDVSKKGKEARPSIDGNSDAVLSCPGCMVLLTRDCQRHEIYSGQYRAMFVENCRVEQESFKIEKTGKERRRERQKMKKMGMDPNEQPSAEEDMFLPVHCAVCSTNVAVMDHEEVYHFFNVLSGYA